METTYRKTLIVVFSLLIISSILLGNTINCINSTWSKTENLLKNEVKVLQFNVTATSPYSVKLQWKLSYNSSNLYIKVIRYFITFESTIAILSSTISNFTDRWVQFGTQYSYKIVVINENNEILAQSETKPIITPIAQNNPGKPLYNWTYYKNIKYPFYQKNYLNYDQNNFTIFRYTLHGVNVTVAVAKNLSPNPSTNFLTNFVNHVFTYFHRHWTIYQAFPINEYRIIILHNGSLYSEDELGLQYGDTGKDAITQVGTGGRLSHEIGHAWIGGILQIERNLPNGQTFNPETQDSDKWIIEGFETFYGNIQLDLQETLNMLQHDLEYYRNTMLGTSLDKPLVDLPIYFGTEYAYTYYCKGELVAYLINKILIDTDNKTLNDFMKYLYSKYNITTWKGRETKLISTEKLLQELNNFSKHNFTEFFQKYVYNTTELPIEKIDTKYIQPLRNFQEQIPTQINMIQTQQLEPQQPPKNTNLIIATSIITAALITTILILKRRIKDKTPDLNNSFPNQMKS
ncbi:MAG: hypothetical protein ACTSYM_04605 [Candidatus Baldrarchaeia archaeon]